GRGRDPHLQAGDRLPRRHVRNARPGLDDAGPPEARRVDAAQRHPHADRQREDGRLPVARLLHGGLMAITKKQPTELAKQVFEYAPAPESTDHIKIQAHYGLFIGGKVVEGHSKKRFPTINPPSEAQLREVGEADEVFLDRAVKAASKAFDSWSRISPSM